MHDQESHLAIGFFAFKASSHLFEICLYLGKCCDNDQNHMIFVGGIFTKCDHTRLELLYL